MNFVDEKIHTGGLTLEFFHFGPLLWPHPPKNVPNYYPQSLMLDGEVSENQGLF